MSDHQPNHHNARRGLATVAFLKARFDAGKDHLDMFQPFVEDAIRHYETDDIELDGIRGAVRASTGLRVPAQILKTLLRRAAKKRLLTRAGGRYLRTPHQEEDSEFAARMQELGRTHLRLGARLLGFAANRGQVLQSDDDALAALTRFLDANQIGIVMGQPLRKETVVDAVRMTQTIAAFVSEIVAEGGQDSEVLENIVKGLIVQNALLLRDIPSIGRHLHGLTVFVDTGVLLRALGYAGATEQHAATESLRLIHAAGARLRAFERTVNETEGVLRVYERNLGSSEGTRSLRPTPLTHHFFSVKATPADIRQEIALLTKNLENLGVRVQEFPKHIHAHTEDEQALADLLKAPERSIESDAERIWHDVEAIAAVLTLRAGARPTRLSGSKYVFASGSAHTVSTAARWWCRDGTLRGLEPLVHFRAVANAAWLLKPANASDVPMHELVAVCAAVLRPSARIWSGFVKHLDQLVTSGDLSDDESIAVLASELTQVALSDHEPEEDVEATTVLEIVERVRQEHEARLRPKLDASRREQEKSERVAALAQAQVALFRVGAQARAERLAGWIAGTIYALLCVVLLVGAVLTLPTEWSTPPEKGLLINLAWGGSVVLFFSVSLLGFFIPRFHVINIFARLRGWLVSPLRRVLLPEAEDGDS